MVSRHSLHGGAPGAGRHQPRSLVLRAGGLSALAGLGGLGGVLIAAGGAGAATRSPQASGSTSGTVVSVDRSADTFEVRTSSGSFVKVKVTSSTSYSEASVSKPSFADVQPGLSIVVIGSTSNGVDTAVDVIIGHRVAGAGGFGGGGFRNGTFGKVTSVDRSADTFVVQTFNSKKVTVKVTSSTTYRDSSVSKAGFSNVTVGEEVAVQGSTSNGVVTAKSVTIGFGGGRGFAPGGGGFGNGTFGKVTSVDRSADTFVVKTTAGKSVTVKVTSKTTYRDRSVSKAGFDDVKVGEQVAVIGSTSNGVETATSVIIGFAGGRRPGGASGSSST